MAGADRHCTSLIYSLCSNQNFALNPLDLFRWEVAYIRGGLLLAGSNAARDGCLMPGRGRGIVFPGFISLLPAGADRSGVAGPEMPGEPRITCGLSLALQAAPG